MRHTPGPWAVHPIKSVVDAFVNGEPVAVCALLWPTDVRTEEETEANASLIAAAPDLLEALKAMQHALVRGNFVAANQLADKAIAKVEVKP